jgi:glyoxalase superfamily protein
VGLAPDTLTFDRADPVKNRVHPNLRPMLEEVDRLRGLGATEVDFVSKEASAVDGQPRFCSVMEDVEGNELRAPRPGRRPRGQEAVG